MWQLTRTFLANTSHAALYVAAGGGGGFVAKQRIMGAPSAIYINTTATRQYMLGSGGYINEVG